MVSQVLMAPFALVPLLNLLNPSITVTNLSASQDLDSTSLIPAGAQAFSAVLPLQASKQVSK